MKVKPYIDRTREAVQTIMDDPETQPKEKLMAAKLLIEITKVRRYRTAEKKKKKKQWPSKQPISQINDLGTLMSKLEQ